jgi:hypothetical protein
MWRQAITWTLSKQRLNKCFCGGGRQESYSKII